MIRTLLGGVIVAAACSLAACGGSSSSSSTPTVAPSATIAPTTAPATASPAPTAALTSTVAPTATAATGDCHASDLYGAFVLSDGTAGTVYYELGLTDVGGSECTIPGPPEVRFQDVSGTGLGITATVGTACSPGGPYDPATCVDNDPIHLLPNDATPAAGTAPGQVTVTVGVANIELFAACPSPNVQAHFIALRFAGTTDDVRIELPQDIDLLTCADQVTLHGYGPSS